MPSPSFLTKQDLFDLKADNKNGAKFVEYVTKADTAAMRQRDMFERHIESLI
jgi:hypothetical protein